MTGSEWPRRLRLAQFLFGVAFMVSSTTLDRWWAVAFASTGAVFLGLWHEWLWARMERQGRKTS